MPLSRNSIVISLLISVFTLVGVITLAGVSAYSAPDASPTVEQTQGRAIYQPIYSNVVGETVDKTHPYTTQAQNKQGVLNAAQFFDADDPTFGIDAAGSALVARWMFNGDAKEVVSGNHGSLQNGPVFTSGQYGQALSFDGNDDYVEVPDNSQLDFAGRSDFSISFWVKSEANNGNWGRLMSKENFSGGRDGWLIFRHANKNQIGFERWRSNNQSSIVADFDPGQWQFFVFTYDGSMMKIYRNDEGVVAQTNSTTDLKDLSEPLRFGSVSTGGGYWGGTLDEVRIYNRALTDQEIKDRYKQNLPDHSILGGVLCMGNGQGTNATTICGSDPQTVFPGGIGEFGSLTLSSTIDGGVEETVSFKNSYTNPVVVAYVMTRNGGQSVEVRVKDITGSSATFFMEEPDNGTHNSEEIGYIVIDQGTHTFPDGTKLEAGKVSTFSVHKEGESFGGPTVSFTQSFGSVPVVLHSLNSYNNGWFMSSVVHNVTNSSFQVEQEAAGSVSNVASEEIGWVAIEAGKSGTINGIRYETGLGSDGSNDGVDDSPHQIDYSKSFASPPVIVVKGNSGNGTDGYWARGAGEHTASKHTVYAEEDQLGNSERAHIDETFGYWALPGAELNKITNVQNPTDPQDAATKAYVDSKF